MELMQIGKYRINLDNISYIEVLEDSIRFIMVNQEHYLVFHTKSSKKYSGGVLLPDKEFEKLTTRIYRLTSITI